MCWRFDSPAIWEHGWWPEPATGHWKDRRKRLPPLLKSFPDESAPEIGNQGSFRATNSISQQLHDRSPWPMYPKEVFGRRSMSNVVKLQASDGHELDAY